MSRIGFSLLGAAALSCLGPGCSHLVETRTIARFTKAIEDADLADLKANASERFERKALRLSQSLDDLEILKLPEGEASIVQVVDVSKNEKNVVAEIGDSKRKLLYRLTKDGQTGKWVVDDIHVNQKHKGLVAAKSVSEQMDLLLTVREFLSAWTGGERMKILESATPRLRSVLEALPPAYLAQLCKQVIGDRAEQRKLRPEAQLDEDVAIVRLPGVAGAMVLSLKVVDQQWKIDDVAVESSGDGEHVPSVLKTAAVVRTAVEFLESYGTGNKASLADLCSKDFYENSLKHADLSSVELPAPEALSGEFDVKLFDPLADVVVAGDVETFKIGLKRRDREAGSGDTPEFLVDDVTIYELDGDQVKRLSALFTAHAIMHVFSKALREGDMAMLKETATVDFNTRVWQQLARSDLDQLPLGEIEPERPVVVSTIFDDAIVEITVMQGRRALTYVLRDHAGAVRVDDVLVPVLARPGSLKATLELVVPVRRVASGIQTADIAILQKHSSTELNRLVWKHAETIPDIALHAPRHLQAPLSSIKPDRDGMILTFGDDRWGAKVQMVKEGRKFVVDNILLVAGTDPEQRVDLTSAYRAQLSRGFRNNDVESAKGVDSGTDLQHSRRSGVEVHDDSVGTPASSPIEPSAAAFTPPAEQTPSVTGTGPRD